ncbi:unnamed protein product [Rhizophagus irregularis]|nr:unnamed protein product [Rhizophagus irregularis]
MFFPINNDKNYSDYKYGMGDLHQRLTELRRCLDDGLINQNGYDSARDEVINFWITNPTVPERSFWQKLYDKAVDRKNRETTRIFNFSFQSFTGVSIMTERRCICCCDVRYQNVIISLRLILEKKVYCDIR